MINMFSRTFAFASVLVSQVWLFLSYFNLVKRRAKEEKRAKKMKAADDEFETEQAKPKRTPRGTVIQK